MTLNLPQMLHDLNHHYHHHRRPSRFRAFRSKTPRRRFLGLAATCRTYRGILPHLVVVPAATPSFASPIPSPPFHPFPTLFSRTIWRSSRDLLPTVPCSPAAYHDDVLLPFVSLSSPRASPSAFLFREASQFQTCQFWFISARSRTDYDLYVPVRRIATLPGLERPSLLIRSRSSYPGRLDTSCSMARDTRSIRASHEIPTSLGDGGGRGINPRDRRIARTDDGPIYRVCSRPLSLIPLCLCLFSCLDIERNYERSFYPLVLIYRFPSRAVITHRFIYRLHELKFMYVIYAILSRKILHKNNFYVIRSKYAASNDVEFR